MKILAFVMIVKNESRCFEKCLAKAKKLVDKIYITDTGSTDNTVEIARKYALAQSDCDWNLVLDAEDSFKYAKIYACV